MHWTEWERFAEQHLRREGLSTLKRNFRCRLGEIDLVMNDRDTTVFVEVRFRQNDDFGGAMASVDRSKQLKIARTAGIFLATHPKLADLPCRFDVVAISGDRREPRLTWQKDAFRG